MKRVIILFFSIMIMGCAMLYTHNLADVVMLEGDYQLGRITGHSAVINSKTIHSGDRALFVEFGADSCLVAEFRKADERYTVELVSFQTYKGALGVFAATDLPGSYPFDLGDGARKNDTMLQFVKGPIIVSVMPVKPASITGAQALAVEIAENIEAPGFTPQLYALLPQSRLVEGSELYFMGKRIFSMNFSEKLAADLTIENIREGYAGTYRTDDGDVEFIKIKYYGAEFAKDAVNSFLKSHSDLPVLLPRESLQFYTVINEDRSETFIADYAEWVYFMPDTPEGRKSRAFFEYIFRGGK